MLRSVDSEGGRELGMEEEEMEEETRFWNFQMLLSRVCTSSIFPNFYEREKIRNGEFFQDFDALSFPDFFSRYDPFFLQYEGSRRREKKM